LINAVIGLLPKIIDTLLKMIPQLIDAAIKLFMAIVQAIPQIVSALIGALIDLGRQMIDGLVKGLSQAGPKILKSLMDAVGGAVNAVKNFLGIKSPSRLFRGFGIMTILGLIKGVHSERNALTKEMVGVANDLASFYDQVGAAAELDAAMNLGATIGVDNTSLVAQIAALNAQLQEIAEKDTINIETLEVNNPVGETTEESLPTGIRKAAYLVG
jgi:phage-related protein